MGYTSSKHPKRDFWIAAVVIAVVLFISLAGMRPAPLWIALLSGGIIAAMSGPIVVTPILYLVRKYADLPYKLREPRTADAVGFVERVVVFLSCVLGYGQYAIAGWFALKTVSQWKEWTQDKGSGRFGEGRARFNLFLIGTSLSVICAVGSVLFALWLHNPDKLSEMFNFGIEWTESSDPRALPPDILGR